MHCYVSDVKSIYMGGYKADFFRPVWYVNFFYKKFCTGFAAWLLQIYRILYFMQQIDKVVAVYIYSLYEVINTLKEIYNAWYIFFF